MTEFKYTPEEAALISNRIRSETRRENKDKRDIAFANYKAGKKYLKDLPVFNERLEKAIFEGKSEIDLRSLELENVDSFALFLKEKGWTIWFDSDLRIK